MKLNENNNKQVVINELFNERINNLTRISASISNAIKKDKNVIEDTLINLQNKIRLIKEDLINIKYAIQWAKYDILNSLLLNKNEIEIALNKLESEEMPFNNAEEALELSEINVLNKEMKIIYIVKIPLTLKETYQKLIIRSVVKPQNKDIINIEYKEILKGKNKIYGIKSRCKDFKKIEICKTNEIIDISNNTCITRIISSLNSTCNISNGHHIPKIEEIQTGIILINNFNGEIDVNTTSQKISGTHLIKFHNTTVKINGQEYANYDAVPFEAIPAVLQPTPIEKNRINLLSLEALQELHINNTQKIDYLKSVAISNSTISIGAIAVILGFLAFTCKLKRRNKLQIVTTKLDSIPTNINLETLPSINPAPIKNSPINQSTYVNFNDLPYF